MAIPRLFIGGGSGALYAPDPASVTDDGATVDLVATPNPSAPAGPSGECVFPLAYLTTRAFADDTITVTPIVDGVALTPHEIDVTGSPEGTIEVHEIDLAEPYPSAENELIRQAPRGSRIELAFASTVMGAVEISVAEIEYEVVRESRTAVA